MRNNDIQFYLGLPSVMNVSPELIEIEHGDTFKLNVEVRDVAGNLTSQPRLNVVCKVMKSFNSCQGLFLLPCLSFVRYINPTDILQE